MIKQKFYKSWDDVPLLLTGEQVAVLFGKSLDTIQRWARNGVLPASKISDEWFFDKNQIKTAFAADRQ